MELRKLSWAALGLLAIVAGCDSPQEAEGDDRADGRRSQQTRQTDPRRRRPPTAAEKPGRIDELMASRQTDPPRRRPPTAAENVVRIDELMASCPDFDQRMGEFHDDLNRLAGMASRVADLRPTLDEVDRFRATSVEVMGQRVGVWVTICRLSPSADALNPVIAKANEVVRRCEQIVRLKTVVAADYRNFKDALAKASAQPTEETLAAVRETAGGLQTRIMLLERTWSDLDGRLASIEGPLRVGRDALDAVTMEAVRNTAREMAYRVGRVLAVTTSARHQLREHRSRISKVTDTLSAISAGTGRR